MGREFELKFRATDAQLDEIRGAFGPFHTITMRTTYYDNPDGEFGRRHWTLRQRMENGEAVCTVKTDLKDGGRGEWEVRCDDLLSAIPRLVALGAPEELAELTARGIVPTCGAAFTRQAAEIPAGFGMVELALDRGVLTGGGQEESFAEVEVELKSGEDSDAVLFANHLVRLFGLTPETRSKLRRARALAGLQ